METPTKRMPLEEGRASNFSSIALAISDSFCEIKKMVFICDPYYHQFYDYGVSMPILEQ